MYYVSPKCPRVQVQCCENQPKSWKQGVSLGFDNLSAWCLIKISWWSSRKPWVFVLQWDIMHCWSVTLTLTYSNWSRILSWDLQNTICPYLKGETNSTRGASRVKNCIKALWSLAKITSTYLPQVQCKLKIVHIKGLFWQKSMLLGEAVLMAQHYSHSASTSSWDALPFWMGAHIR